MCLARLYCSLGNGACAAAATDLVILLGYDGSCLEDRQAEVKAASGVCSVPVVLQALRPESIILMGKNTMMKRSIRLYCEETGNDQWAPLLDELVGNVGLIFTKGDLAQVRNCRRQHSYGGGMPDLDRTRAAVCKQSGCSYQQPETDCHGEPSQQDFTSSSRTVGIADSRA